MSNPGPDQWNGFSPHPCDRAPHSYNHRSLLAILISNRQINTEAIPVFYGRNTFGFSESGIRGTRAPLLYFLRSTSRWSRRCIQSIELTVHCHRGIGTYGSDAQRDKKRERSFVHYLADNLRRVPNLRRLISDLSQGRSPHSDRLLVVYSAVFRAPLDLTVSSCWFQLDDFDDIEDIIRFRTYGEKKIVGRITWLRKAGEEHWATDLSEIGECGCTSDCRIFLPTP